MIAPSRPTLDHRNNSSSLRGRRMPSGRNERLHYRNHRSDQIFGFTRVNIEHAWTEMATSGLWKIGAAGEELITEFIRCMNSAGRWRGSISYLSKRAGLKPRNGQKIIKSIQALEQKQGGVLLWHSNGDLALRVRYLMCAHRQQLEQQIAEPAEFISWNRAAMTNAEMTRNTPKSLTTEELDRLIDRLGDGSGDPLGDSSELSKSHCGRTESDPRARNGRIGGSNLLESRTDKPPVSVSFSDSVTDSNKQHTRDFRCDSPCGYDEEKRQEVATLQSLPLVAQSVASAPSEAQASSDSPSGPSRYMSEISGLQSLPGPGDLDTSTRGSRNFVIQIWKRAWLKVGVVHPDLDWPDVQRLGAIYNACAAHHIETVDHFREFIEYTVEAYADDDLTVEFLANNLPDMVRWWDMCAASRAKDPHNLTDQEIRGLTSIFCTHHPQGFDDFEDCLKRVPNIIKALTEEGVRSWARFLKWLATAGLAHLPSCMERSIEIASEIIANPRVDTGDETVEAYSEWIRSELELWNDNDQHMDADSALLIVQASPVILALLEICAQTD